MVFKRLAVSAFTRGELTDTVLGDAMAEFVMKSATSQRRAAKSQRQGHPTYAHTSPEEVTQLKDDQQVLREVFNNHTKALTPSTSSEADKYDAFLDQLIWRKCH